MKILRSKILREKLGGHVTQLMTPRRGPPLSLCRAYFGFVKKSIFPCHNVIYVVILAWKYSKSKIWGKLWPIRYYQDVVHLWAIVAHILFFKPIFLVVRWVNKRVWPNNKQTQKLRAKKPRIQFSTGGLAPSPEIFRVDADHIAAHLTLQVVWGPNPTNGDTAQKRCQKCHAPDRVNDKMCGTPHLVTIKINCYLLNEYAV